MNDNTFENSRFIRNLYQLATSRTVHFIYFPNTLDLPRNLYQLATWRTVQLYFIYFPNTLNLYKKS
jgi:hypothetical protein